MKIVSYHEYSFNNNTGVQVTEIIQDRNIYTGEHYKNIFELRHTKIKWMLEDLPNKVKNCIFIRYQDLINDFDKTLLKIKDKGLEIKKNINFPLNTDNYKNTSREKFVKKKNSISTKFILSNPNLIPSYEKYIYNEKKYNRESQRLNVQRRKTLITAVLLIIIL